MNFNSNNKPKPNRKQIQMNKKLASALLAAGMTFGGAAAASAAYDGSGTTPDETPTAEVQDQSTAPQNGGIVNVQDTEGEADELEAPEADAEGAEDGDREGRRGRGGCKLDTAAEVIGIDVEALRSALDEGQTIAEVAADNGVSADAVIDAMVEAAEERLSEKVEEGRITQNEADDKLVEKTDRIEDRVNGTTEEA